MGLVAINRYDGEWVGQTYEREKTNAKHTTARNERTIDMSAHILFFCFLFFVFSFMDNWPNCAGI